MAGRTISPQLATLVLVHGAAMTAWLALFLTQSMLVAARRLPVRMKRGWGAAGAAMVMLAEGALFTVLVLADVLSRQRPRIHRTTTLLASLSILAGATVRTLACLIACLRDRTDVITL